MIAATAAAVLGMAIVTQDQAALRAAPSASATTQAQLWQGDLLEVRAERLDHLQVYDHARERAGYVRATQVRLVALNEAESPQLLSVLRFLRDTPGAEPLGIAYVAAYLKAAPAAAITAEPFDALGVMAERLARRASQRQSKPNDTLAAHLEVASRYGVKFNTYELDGAMRLCYDGEAFRRVLAMAATAEQQARAALALTRHDCADPAAHPQQRQTHDRWRAEVLDRVRPEPFAQLSEPARNRVRLRRAGVWAALAFDAARSGDAEASRQAAQRAIDNLAAINKTELGDEETTAFAEAAVRVGAARWGALPPVPQPGRLAVRLQPGEAGQTCVQLHGSSGPAAAPLAQRCTYGVAWLASARSAPDGRALVIAVQPLAGWTELWVFRSGPQGWRVDVLPPAPAEPGLGYAEFAGWVPNAGKLLLVRESCTEGRHKRTFEVLALDTLATERQASRPDLLVAFGKWQDVTWKARTVSQR